MEEKAKSNRRRRERALKMRAEISESAKASEDSCEESVPRVRTKPPRPRKKNKDPLFEEDVVEGFAFLAFKNYEDLEVSGENSVAARVAGWQGPACLLRPPHAGQAGQGGGQGWGATRAVLEWGTWCWGTMVARGTPPSTLRPGVTRVESARPPPPCNTALPHMLPQHADVYAAGPPPPQVGVRGQGQRHGRLELGGKALTLLLLTVN